MNFSRMHYKVSLLGFVSLFLKTKIGLPLFALQLVVENTIRIFFSPILSILENKLKKSVVSLNK